MSSFQNNNNEEPSNEENKKKLLPKETNTSIKRKTYINSNLDDTCLIGCFAFYHNITVRRSTLKSNDHIEKFIIVKVDNEEIEEKVRVDFEEFKQKLFILKPNAENRTVFKSLQNIYLNNIMDYLIKNQNQINEFLTRRPKISVRRRRFKTFNGRTLEECRQFGYALNHFLQENIPTNKKKKETQFVITRDLIDLILEQYPMSPPF
ncbi:hypothetical protein EDI_289690 [Entamoeba dispar SAW760]|uniref:Uncharacterized protein n=1 Tax=Entamoeba dispar (strain ATCC PRA-260 / SAW760) TaxID=370354 RepID=B0EVC3_ENTDS|nr:uncharacterized protein EDI_289690 [Entamoeba dispar SAW760]EDR21535.1 hypothetical protein EDI_289690 [Entamoeba dispar SAW760]|eukprot:EDR21535.1 hypothetical protein EDI_289690 [Entamoeba dispar SAW760]